MKNVHCSHHYLYFSHCSTVASVFVVAQLTTNWYLMTDTVIHLQHHAVGILKNCTDARLQWIKKPRSVHRLYGEPAALRVQAYL